MKNSNITLFIPITQLSDEWSGEFQNLPPNKTYELVIDYPLVEDAIFKIKTGKRGMSLIKLLGKIGSIYEKIYNNADRYMVRNHDIGDLQLEGIRVNHKNKRITLSIGS